MNTKSPIAAFGSIQKVLLSTLLTMLSSSSIFAAEALCPVEPGQSLTVTVRSTAKGWASSVTGKDTAGGYFYGDLLDIDARTFDLGKTGPSMSADAQFFILTMGWKATALGFGSGPVGGLPSSYSARYFLDGHPLETRIEQDGNSFFIVSTNYCLARAAK